jgi:hypothetical protein
MARHVLPGSTRRGLAIDVRESALNVRLNMPSEKHEDERPVLLHKFKSSSGRIATTSDGSGGNLPKEDGPWEQFASQVVNADDTANVGTSSLDILADVKADGFSLFPRKKPGA